MTTSTPAIILLVWFAIVLLVSAHLHGTPKPKGDFSFWSTLLSQAIAVAFLYWGGFFN